MASPSAFQPIRMPAARPAARRMQLSARPQLTAAGDRHGISGLPGVVLALGGGFARGFAHLGVLEVLEQEQIPVTGIVGTSIGALLGAAYADGLSSTELCSLGALVRVRDFVRFQQHEPGLRPGNLLGEFVRSCFQAGKLEEVAIPTSLVATDLGSGAAHVFTSGSLELAIRASCAFPGLFKPVEHEGRLLADGCIASPVPTEVADRMYGGCVVGVSVSPASSTTMFAHRGTDRITGSTQPFEMAVEPSWMRHADLALEPQVQHLGWSDFSSVHEAFVAGTDAMRAAIPELRRLLAAKRRAYIPPVFHSSSESESRT